jgi:hypothetical protein
MTAPCTREEFEEWKYHPVTQRLFSMMLEESGEMKDGLVMGSYDNEDEVKGRCKAIANLLRVEYEDLYASE